MAYLSKDEFLSMQAQKEANRQNYAERTQGPRVGFFGLRDDGDEAIVRIAAEPEEFEVYTVHPVTVDGKFRKVNCINDLKAGEHSCPLCEAGVQLQNRFYIRLIEYTRDEQGNIKAEPRIWERPTTYIQRLMNLYTEYGSLKNNVFKVKRRGERGSMQTDYEFLFANPQIYNEQLYPKDFSAFEGYSPLNGAIINRNKEELAKMVVDMGLAKPAEPVRQAVSQQQPVQQTVVATSPSPIGYGSTADQPVRRTVAYN